MRPDDLWNSGRDGKLMWFAPPENPNYQRSVSGIRPDLWAVLAINAAMFAVEIGAGLAAGSAGERMQRRR